jgi:hypothetical protein
MTPQERGLINQCQTYDLAESQRLRRAILAKEAGLPPAEFGRPFPGNRVTITHNHLPESSMLKKLAPLLLSGLLGAGSAGALALATGAIPKALPGASAPQSAPHPVDLRVKWWLENGQIKTSVDPVPGSPPSPGGSR